MNPHDCPRFQTLEDGILVVTDGGTDWPREAIHRAARMVSQASAGGLENKQLRMLWGTIMTMASQY